MKFSKEQLAGIADRLREMPAKEDARKHSKRDAVAVLAREIAELKRRGYTLEQIAEALSASGLPISTPTLKNYLHRTRQRTETSAASRPVNSRRAAGKQTGRPVVAFDPTPDSDDI